MSDNLGRIRPADGHATIETFVQPGVASMPPWNHASLPEAPTFRWRNIAFFVGPAIVMAASAVGGGEWLTGPMNTARYGAAMFWLATLSILGQVVYNIEICRYTLYTGEPIFTGKFRLWPGPSFYVFLYLFLDFGSFLPYLASNAATPLFALIFRRLPVTQQLTQGEVGTSISWLGWQMTDHQVMSTLSVIVFLGVFVPLLFGGKVYRSMRILMTFKLVVVFSFLLYLAFAFSNWQTWSEIFQGFLNFGAVPVKSLDGTPHIDNMFSALLQGRSLEFDLSLLGFLTAMAALAGNGGLTNTPVSNYTRDQGWGMGAHVGAIPSIVGGHEIKLSHEGSVFHVDSESLPRWRGWLRHVRREQLLLWMPGCFVGLALPSMLSLVFLPRGVVPNDKWQVAGMTADGVRQAVTDAHGAGVGNLFWYLTLFVGFLILSTAMAATADGVLRRWVDVFWTASSRLRTWDVKDIGKLYFGVLCIYALLGCLMLLFFKGDRLLVLSTMMYNYALGVSCFHTLFVNQCLLPKALQPGWFIRVTLVLTGCFFTAIAVLTTWGELAKLK